MLAAIEHVGGYGLELARGCQHNKISRCTIDDLGAGGIKIGETAMRGAFPDQTFGNEISDCRITDGGCFYPSGVGAWFGQTYDNVLSHNEISNFYYTGISIGWTWGYGKSLPRNNVRREQPRSPHRRQVGSIAAEKWRPTARSSATWAAFTPWASSRAPHSRQSLPRHCRHQVRRMGDLFR